MASASEFKAAWSSEQTRACCGAAARHFGDAPARCISTEMRACGDEQVDRRPVCAALLSRRHRQRSVQLSLAVVRIAALPSVRSWRPTEAGVEVSANPAHRLGAAVGSFSLRAGAVPRVGLVRLRVNRIQSRSRTADQASGAYPVARLDLTALARRSLESAVCRSQYGRTETSRRRSLRADSSRKTALTGPTPPRVARAGASSRGPPTARLTAVPVPASATRSDATRRRVGQARSEDSSLSISARAGSTTRRRAAANASTS